jgi:hypothetical protein
MSAPEFRRFPIHTKKVNEDVEQHYILPSRANRVKPGTHLDL